MRGVFRYHLPPAVYMAVILYLSLRPPPIGPPLFLHADKLIHFAAYAVMAALWMRTFARAEATGRAIAASILISFVFGAFVEVMQSYAPPREASLLDAAANGLGAIAGAYAFKRFARHGKTAREV